MTAGRVTGQGGEVNAVKTKISYFPKRSIDTWVHPERDMEISEVLGLIKKNVLAASTKTIRDANDEETQNRLKKELPFVTWSGSFDYKSDSTLKKHSGLLCLDFDKIDSKKLMRLRARIEKNIYTRIVFLSPRGAGLKVIIAIPATDAEKHKKYFNAAQLYFQNAWGVRADDSGADVSRACFLCHDEKLYFNSGSIKFTQMLGQKTDPGNGKAPEIEPGTAILNGQRNETLTTWAGKMRRIGLTPGEILAALLERNRSCDPPLSPAEVEGIARSVARYEPAPVGLHAMDPNAAPLSINLSEVEALPIDWLWESFIPIGEGTLFSANPGDGKSFFVMDIAARLSRGTRWLDGTPVGEAANTLYLTVEDPQ
jgi:hypothetical protein